MSQSTVNTHETVHTDPFFLPAQLCLAPDSRKLREMGKLRNLSILGVVVGSLIVISVAIVCWVIVPNIVENKIKDVRKIIYPINTPVKNMTSILMEILFHVISRHKSTAVWSELTPNSMSFIHVLFVLLAIT